jgi:hypothetical protein
VSGQETRETEAVSDFKATFGVPAGHVLRQVNPAPHARASVGCGQWEHEEYDKDGNLVAVYESWSRGDGGLAFVKYSPHGWVLSISGRSPRFPPLKVRVRPVEAA